ncbi:MAG: translation initiation factor IF-2 [Omnitrophica WOR_2 bacterium RBG_13_41_10]|nr:MAG: translation initiation factor IF-2 [Omnitrophica WOR_2 bacterium RBG_13_41_10]
MTVKDLAIKLQEKPSLLIKKLMDMRIFANINQVLDEAVVTQICQKYGYQIKKAPDEEESLLLIHEQTDSPKDLQPRPPIVTLMGHVDHGKTSLLDAIRKTKVAESEHGGITQHIGAYRVSLPEGEITFLDTPGHEAFTAMRARGAKATDIVVLVVAADEGIMPQTQEAIDHARAAGVAIMVAINKIDKPQANIDKVKKHLSELNLTAEDWGGKTITVAVSAKTGQGIDNLLEMILLEAQMLELKANPAKIASGVVIEAKMAKGKGPVATLLVQNGTLRLNENIIVGRYYGKVRAMFDNRGQLVQEARPSFPAEVLGLSGVPEAGEKFFVISEEKTARDLALRRQEKEHQEQLKSTKRISLEDLYSQIKAGRLKEIKLVIKSDVQGSLQAIKDVLNKLNISEIKLDIIHEGVGNINASDVILAVASNALILGFHVDSDDRAKELITKEGVDVRIYNVIYELGNDIKAAIEGMLEPKLKKIFIGKAEVRKVFKVSRTGTVAGCFIIKGKIMRSNIINLVRNGEVAFEGKISSLKRFKDDAREVAEGFDCGITLAGFDDFKEGDLIEAYEIEKIARKLE